MTARQQKPRKGVIAAASSCLVATLCFAGTAIAAHNATAVEINAQKNDDLAADELLTPPPDGSKTPAAQIVVEQPDQAESELPDARPRIPGISDNGLARFKRQMYRRDI